MAKTVCFLALTTSFSLAYAGCPSGYYSKTVGVKDKHLGLKLTLKTVCLPNGNVLVTQMLSPITGPTLALWIQESRNSAIGQAQGIPDDIRAELQGYVEDSVMDRARFKVGDNGVANLGRLVNKYGDVNAITLDDLIVFHNEEAADSPAVWAHELTHVKQFSSQGVIGFATRYAANYRDVENPAYAKGNGYDAWAQTQIESPQNQIANDDAGDGDGFIPFRGSSISASSSDKSFYWVGIAWNNDGQFIAWTDTSDQAAQNNAVALCNQNYGNCFSMGHSVPGDSLMCFSIFRDGKDLFEAHDSDTQAAASQASQSCLNSPDPGSGCQLIISACNDMSPPRIIFEAH